MLKIYKIWQTVNKEYDTFDSAIVVADNEQEAKKMTPNEYSIDSKGIYHEFPNVKPEILFFGKPQTEHTDWAYNIDDVNVEYIGEAKDGMKKGVIVGSFNAG